MSLAARMLRTQPAARGRLPLLRNERDQRPGHAVLAHLICGISLRSLLLGGYVAKGAGAISGLVALLAGSLLGTGLAAAAAVPCNRYGLDPADAAKPCLGYRGARALLVLFVLRSWMGSGLMLVMLGRAVQNFLGAGGLVGGNALVSLMVALGVWATYIGVLGNDIEPTPVRAWAMPSLAILGLIVMFAVLHDIAWPDIVSIPPLSPPDAGPLHAPGAFECVLGASLTRWSDVAQLGRRADRQRTAFYAAWMTLAAATTAMGMAGLCAALLWRSYDPTQWLIFLGGRAFGALLLIIVMVGSSTAARRMMRAAMPYLQHAPRLLARGKKWCVGLMTAPLLVFALFPHALYEHGDAILVSGGYLLGPLACVTVVDYMLLRRQCLNPAQVFNSATNGHYWFVRGFNPHACAAVAAGAATAWLLYNPWTAAIHPWARTAGATLPGVAVTGVAYALVSLMGRAVWGAPRGGYGADDAA